MQPAIFLDRDGVIIENCPDYVRSWSDVHIYPHAIQALAKFSITPYKIVIITNQSAVGRGIISISTAREINARLIQLIQDSGGRVDGVFMCPHTPEDGCGCRKPQPGLLLEAARALSIDLSQSIMIGDAVSDLLAGEAAGIPKNILLMTGRGADQHRMALCAKLQPFLVYDNLVDALTEITG